MKVLFIGDKSTFSQEAYKNALELLPDTQGIFWDNGDLPRPNLQDWHGDLILSFKSDLVLDESILKKASTAAINFHPAPPTYRGIGTYSWALHHQETTYGVTCHHMIRKIDFGKIIAVRYFPISKGETAASLKLRAGTQCLNLFNEILMILVRREPLPLAEASWSGKLYTYNDLRHLPI